MLRATCSIDLSPNSAQQCKAALPTTWHQTVIFNVYVYAFYMCMCIYMCVMVYVYDGICLCMCICICIYKVRLHLGFR